MDERITHLLNAGFKPAGHWHLHEHQAIRFALAPELADGKFGLYAFLANKNLVYIGITRNALKARLLPYAHPPKLPGNGGETNMRNNAKIRSVLLAGGSVEILAINNLFSANDFENGRDPLKESESILVAALKPEWNLSSPLQRLR